MRDEIECCGVQQLTNYSFALYIWNYGPFANGEVSQTMEFIENKPPGELDSSDWRQNACQLNQVFCNEVRLRQSRNRQGFISWASDECGRESSTLGSDCIPDVRCNHATRGRPHVELLSNHVIHDLSWLVRACRLDAELPLKIFSETGMFAGAFATG